MYSRLAVAAILVVDVTSQSSYDHIEMWLSIVEANCASDCKVYVVANKCDLDCVIALDKLEEFAADRAFPFFRTSAKDHASVAAVFQAVAEHLGQAGKGRSAVITAAPPAAGGCC
jgi:Ras-related protein Rab-1A